METNCFDLDDINNNLGCEGNSPGVAQRVIYGYCEDVATWPKSPTPKTVGEAVTPLTLEEAGVWVGDLVMNDKKRAFAFDFTADTGNLKIAPGGQVDGTSFTYTLTIVKAQISKKVLGFMNAASGKKMFMLVQDENGVWYLLGNARRGVTIGGDGADTGTSGDDRNQTTLTFAFRNGKALAYEGDTEDLLVLAPSA